MTLVEILTGAHVALKVIQARLLTLLALIFTAGIFAWAMWLQTVLGAIIAATWGLLIFLPVLYTGRGGNDAAPQRQPQRPEDEPNPGSEDGA